MNSMKKGIHRNKKHGASECNKNQVVEFIDSMNSYNT
jgi:hypothetical protein